jgi:hypothetical protein
MMLTKALHTEYEHLSIFEDEKVLKLLVYARARGAAADLAAERQARDAERQRHRKAGARVGVG